MVASTDRVTRAMRGNAAGMTMSIGWIVLGLVGWGFGLLVTLALFRMSGDQDRNARHEQKRMDPYSDVTITQTGSG